jgi:hypothetical protein
MRALIAWSRVTVGWTVVVLSTGGLSDVVAGARASQVELDRVVSRVNSRIITESDVRQARLLHLVAETSSDAVILRQLENRLLMLGDIARSSSPPIVSDGQVAAHRSDWESTVGGSERAGALLGQVALGEAGLTTWLRYDLRIRAHVERLFGALPEADRSRAEVEWMARLRQRADLN